jgi:Caspase domain
VRRSTLPLCIFLIFAAVTLPSAAWAKRVALVVGIDQYDNLSPAQQLKKAVNDAHAIGETLRSLGYDVQQADNVSRLDFLRQWQQFLNRMEPGDEAAIDFAGHGVEIGGLNFLIPRDVPRVASGEEELLKASSLSLSDLLEQVRDRQPRMTLFAVDACRDNPFVNSNKTPGKIGDIARDVRRDVRELASQVHHVQIPAFYDELIGDFCPTGCVVAAKDSTAPDKPQLPPPDPALEAWNATKGSDSVGELEVFVGKYPATFYAELAKARIEELKRKERLAAVAPKPQPPDTDPALEAWNAIKGTDDLAMHDTFIGTYPTSFYAELARVHRDELKKKQEAALVAPPHLRPHSQLRRIRRWRPGRRLRQLTT